MNIVRADSRNRCFLPAVHIYQRLETMLFAGAEQPVDRALLINFTVVGVEAVQQIIANDLPGRTLAAEGIGDEFQVLLQRVITVDHAHKLDHTGGQVVLKVGIIADWDDVVLIGDNGLVFAVVPLAACISKPLDIQ